MERNSLTNSLKDHSIDTRAIKYYCVDENKNMPKDSANCDSQSYGDDYVNGFSWPPRSYTCSFCKREFKSAQALGGHMNVHRRDRARLRQSPPRDGQYPFLNLNCNPNPKFSPSSSSSLSSPSTRLTPFAFPLSSFISPTLSPLTSPSSASPKWGLVGSLFDSLSPKSMDLTKLKSEKSFNGGEEFDHGFKERGGLKIFKKHEIARLDLEVDFLRDSKEDIDLELRLGNS